VSEIKSEIKERVSKICVLSAALLKVRDEFAQADGKYLDELSTFLQEALLAGLKETGEYSPNALAKFISCIMGVYIEDTKVLIDLLRRGEAPRVRVRCFIPNFWKIIEYIADISREIVNRFTGYKQFSISINKPIDFVYRLVELLNELMKILPQFNEKTRLIWTLANNVYWYLKEVSKPENNIYPNILEKKELLESLGVTVIKQWQKPKYSPEYDIIGYPDYSKALLNHSVDIILLTFDLRYISTLGGAVCKLIELTYELFGKISDKRYLFKTMFKHVKDFELEYTEKLKPILFNYLRETKILNDLLKVCIRFEERDSRYSGNIVRKLRDIWYYEDKRCELSYSSYKEGGYTLELGFIYFYPPFSPGSVPGSTVDYRWKFYCVFVYDDRCIVTTTPRRFLVFDLLDEIAPLMFARLVMFIPVEGKVRGLEDKDIFILLPRLD